MRDFFVKFGKGIFGEGCAYLRVSRHPPTAQCELAEWRQRGGKTCEAVRAGKN